MATHATDLSDRDARSEPRDPVDYRARASAPGGRILQLQVVNISARGLMARCEAPVTVGERITVSLPVVGAVPAVIRWALGGRLGCELDRQIPHGAYYGLLGALVRR